MRFMTFGEMMLRLSPPESAPLTQSLPGPLHACFGGAEANVAVALARLGAPASFVSAIPAGPLGETGLIALRGRGVDTTHILRPEKERMGLYFLESGVAFRPSRVIYDRADAAFSRLKPGDLDWKNILPGTEWFHLSGISPAVSSLAAETVAAAVAAVVAAGIPLSLDLNYRGRLWQWGGRKRAESLAQEVMKPLAEQARVIIGNEEDAARVLGLSIPGLDLQQGQLDPVAYRDLVRQVAKRCPQAKFIGFSLRQSKNASINYWGGVLHDVAADQTYFHPNDPEEGFVPLEINPVVDRVGSGDAFAAGLIFALGHQRVLPAKAIALAVAAGALGHTYQGDWLESSLAEVEALARGDVAGRIKR